MPEYLSPGVYVEEIDTGPKPIAPVATSTAGMVGYTLRGPSEPTLITNYGAFVRTYGGALPIPTTAERAPWETRGHWWHIAESVKGFFDEGGARLYFQRVAASGAAASSAPYNGGLYAALETDIEATSTVATLAHTFSVVPGPLVVRSEDGSVIGSVDVTGVDHATRTITFAFADPTNPFEARRRRDVLEVVPVDAALAVLTAAARDVGVWGDALSAQILPAQTARLSLAATPTSGGPVVTSTTVAALTGAATINVATVAGTLVAATATPFWASIDGGGPVEVTNIADAAPDITFTLGAVLTADLAAASEVRVLRPAVNGSVVTVGGAARLYAGAMVQLDGTAGAEQRTVASVSGAQVTLSAAPANAYIEGDALALLEAEVRVRVQGPDGLEVVENFAGLRLTHTGTTSELIGAINDRSNFIELTAGADYDGADPQAFPAIGSPWAQFGGGDDALASLSVADFVGRNDGPGQRTGIHALEDIDQVAICAVPGMWHPDVRNGLIVHCETLADRFAILDSPPGLTVQEIEAFRSPIDTKYAALYYPWLDVADPRPGGPGVTVPPSAFMAGIYARTDTARGVHKAPANETVRSIRRLHQAISKREQDILNPQNINVLRSFPGRGNRVWGARVLTSDSAWKYINVRRLFIMIEESIDEATQWVVFEPNDEPTWARVRQSVTQFLTTQWRIGALQGTKAGQAFFVTCDYSTMTQDDIDNGRLICEIGIAPVKPAEFVIFRIQQKTLELTSA